MNIRKYTLTTITASAIALSGCFSGTEETAESNNIIPNTNSALYEIPSTLVNTATASNKRIAAKTEESLFDAYKPIPAYITIAEQARDVVAEILNNLYEQDLPEEFSFTEDGKSISIQSLDSLGAAWAHIEWSDANTGEELDVKVFKGTEVKGQAILRNELEGIEVRVLFSNEDEATLGRRLRVKVTNLNQELENINDPQVIVVNAFKKGDKVFISGTSYHPGFTDEDGFWYEGETTPSVYAFQAFANETKEQAVLRAAFAPSSEVGPGLMTDYALDTKIIDQIRLLLIKEADKNQNFLKAFFWSLDKELPVEDVNQSDIILYNTDKTADDITAADVEAFSAIQLAATNVDPFFVELTAFAQAKQPIFLKTGAIIQGNSDILSPEEILVDASELDETPELEEISLD